jgi:predicted ATPase
VAVALLNDYPDGVLLVELASPSDTTLVPETVAAPLGLREEPGALVTAARAEYVRAKRLLLILDNCEQVLEGCAELAASLLQHGPNLHLLATSRERLGIGGELGYHVPSLPVPAAGERLSPADMLAHEAVRLFVDRARSRPISR